MQRRTQRFGQERLRIAYLTLSDPNDRRSWSGTVYRMARALEKHCGGVFNVGPLIPPSLKVGKVMNRSIKYLAGRTYLHTHTTSLSKKVGQMASEKLRGANCDVIFAAAASTAVAHLKTDLPIVYSSDTTARLMVDYYPAFSALLPTSLKEADEIERLAIQKSAHLVYPSSWAGLSANQDYGADSSRIHIVPFGANIDEPPAREEIVRPVNRGVCRLLFVGVEWGRKGGDIALETLQELDRLGVPAELTVVGCRPPRGASHERLNVIPFINKNDPQGRVQLDRLFKTSDFFLLPTRAECFGIAVCEACAYGLPVLSTQTGGLPELVRDGLNGFLFPLEARGDRYAARICDVYRNAETYQALCASSREEYERRLNWDAWGKQIREILLAAVAQDNLTPADCLARTTN
jgi:glycosyltransferase involved in cell wall biosynthesis